MTATKSYLDTVEMTVTGIQYTPNRRTQSIRYERSRGRTLMVAADEQAIEVSAVIRDQAHLETLRDIFAQYQTSIYFDCRQRPMWTGYYVIGPGPTIDDQTKASTIGRVSFTLIEADGIEDGEGIGEPMVAESEVGWGETTL